MDRDAIRAQSMQDRYTDAVRKLEGERQVKSYLESQGKHGAASYVADNIQRMERTVSRLENEIPRKKMN